MVERFGRALFPVPCVACGTRGGEPLCPSCRAAVRPARPGPVPLGCDRLVAAFSYAGPAREVVARVKYRDARHALPFLARAVAPLLDASVALPADTIVSWPPTTRAHRRTRGFDHAAALARRVAGELDLPARPLLTRVDVTAQTGRAARDRRRGPRLALRPGAVVAETVVLVDDVVTTGATLTAAARVLRAHGARTIVAAAVARTPPPGAPD